MSDELDYIHKRAELLLAEAVDPVVRFRLLRDVLCKPSSDAEVVQTWEQLSHSRWVQELEREQRSDGSWGRFHSRDSQVRQTIPTTEMGVDRALRLGLAAGHPLLDKTTRYLAHLLDSPVSAFPDRPEKNDRWPTAVRLFTAATLALVQPNHTALDDTSKLWTAIFHRAFASGRYNVEAEIQAHHELTGASVRNSYLALNGKYQLILLSARPGTIATELEYALLHWIWHKNDGIGYVGIKLSTPPQHLTLSQIHRWLLSLELLTRFPGWRPFAGEAVEWLWKQQDEAGYWDFGRVPAIIQLSENRRKKTARRVDWTVRVLILLRKFYKKEP